MKKSFTLAIVLGLLAAGGGAADGATMPFHETFDDDALGNPIGSPPPITQGEVWSELFDDDWRVESDGAGRDDRGTLIATPLLSRNVYGLAPEVPGAPGSNFTTSVDFEIESLTTESDSDMVAISLRSLYGFGTTYRATYRMVDDGDPTRHERLLLYRTDDLPGRGVSTNTLAPVADGSVTYSLSLKANYAIPGDPTSLLMLDAMLTDGITVLTASLTDPTPLQDSAFGLVLIAAAGHGGTAGITADFDNFEITPEPASVTLLLVGVLGVIRRRRKLPLPIT